MNKRKSLVVLAWLVLLFTSSFVYGLMFIGDFSQGFFQNTFYNGSVLKLNSGNLTGLYISSIFDAGNISNWTSVSWNSTEQGELSNYRQGDLMNGNILLYHLNELSGNITDYSNNSINATTSGGVLYNQQGKIGGAVGFDGIDDYLNLSSAQLISTNTPFTISMWFKSGGLSPSNDFDMLFSTKTNQAQNWRFGITNYVGFSDITFGSNANFISAKTGSVGLTNNVWYSLIIVYNGTNPNSLTSYKLYLSGAEKSLSASSPYGVETGNTYIGRSSGGYYFNGSIDEVAVWNRSLNQAEIKDLYRRGASKLNLSVQGCGDGNCTDSNWTLINGTSPQNISIFNKRYFQYKFYFETINSNFNQEVYGLGVDYFLSGNQSYQNNQTNQTENPPDTNVTLIEGGSSGGTYKEDEQKQITISYSKEELTRQILSILIGVLVFIGLIILLVYLIIKVAR
jgi:hypothetical protein